jgi:hypothetical protein
MSHTFKIFAQLKGIKFHPVTSNVSIDISSHGPFSYGFGTGYGVISGNGQSCVFQSGNGFGNGSDCGYQSGGGIGHGTGFEFGGGQLEYEDFVIEEWLV